MLCWLGLLMMGDPNASRKLLSISDGTIFIQCKALSTISIQVTFRQLLATHTIRDSFQFSTFYGRNDSMEPYHNFQIWHIVSNRAHFLSLMASRGNARASEKSVISPIALQNPHESFTFFFIEEADCKKIIAI